MRCLAVLISCPSCGKRISNRAPACPFCKTVANPAAPAAASVPAPPPPSAVSAAEPAPTVEARVAPPAPAISAPAPEPEPAPLPLSVPALAPEPDLGLTVPYVDPDPEPTRTVPPGVAAPPVSSPSNDPTATLPPSPALFARFDLKPSAPPAPPPAELAAVQAVPVPPPAEETPPPQKHLADSDSASVAIEATEHLNAGRYADALTMIDRLLETQPRNGEAHNTRAQALFGLGRREDAARAIVKAIEAVPDSLAFWLNKAVMEHEEGKAKEACRSAMELVEIALHGETESPTVEQGRQMIATFEATGAFPSARGYLGWLGLGCVSMKAGRPETALEFFDRAIDAASGKSDGFRWKGKALVQLDQVDEAFGLFDAAIEVDPHDPDAHYERGMAFAILGDSKRAIEDFDAALAIDPHHAGALKEKRDLAE